MKHKWKSTKLNNNVIIYDYETGCRGAYKAEPIEISAICMDINTLELKTDLSGNMLEFTTLVKPTDWSLVEDESLAKNRIKREELEKENVPTQEFAMRQFFEFCRQFQHSDKKWDACYSAGFNICGFDNIISYRMCERYGYVDKEGEALLFHPFHNFDLMNILRMYFCWGDDLSGYSLDSARDFFGISREGAHRASKDVMDSYIILKRFIQFYKQLAPKKIPQFRNCFGGDNK